MKRGPILLLLLVACAATPHRKRPTDGSIAGLVRDHGSGEPVAMAELRVEGRQGRTTTSSPEGLYAIDHLKPGRYTLLAQFAGQPVTIRNIDVHAGDATFVDVTFTLGNPDPIVVDFGDPMWGAVQRYHPKSGAAQIEGTVSDLGSRDRLAGAVVTAYGGPRAETLQTISDEHGRFRFDHVVPGSYKVSAYYSLGGRAQIEMQREIDVEGAQGVFVPLWVEVQKQ